MLHFAHHTAPGRSVLNSMYDFLVMEDYIFATIKSSKENRLPISDKIRLVAFDKGTYDASKNRGYWTPRVLLARSIQHALKLGAQVVVVDFAVNRAVPLLCENDVCIDENKEFLKVMHESASLARKQKAMIILAWSSTSGEVDKNSFQGFQDLLRQEKDVITLASAKGFLNPEDNKVRHFSLYEIDSGKKEVMYSIELMAALFSLYGVDSARELMNNKKDSLLGHDDHISFPRNEEKGISSILLCDPGSHGECLAARYHFRLTPRELTTSIFNDRGINIKDPLITTPELLLTPRVLLAQNSDNKKKYKDKIVIIGSTNSDFGDVHATPLGRMSGIYLIANGVNVLLENLQVRAPSSIIVYGIEAVIILGAALFFLHLSQLAATIVMALIILICISPFSLFLFSKYGLFMDFWFPIIGIGLHKIIAESEQWLALVFRKKKEIQNET